MSSEIRVANKAFRAFLLGIEDVLGKHGVEAVMHRANLPQYIGNYPPSTMEREHSIRYFSQIARAMYDIYGGRGARAIMQRVGRSQAEIGLQENAALVALARLGMKLLPLRQQDCTRSRCKSNQRTDWLGSRDYRRGRVFLLSSAQL